MNRIGQALILSPLLAIVVSPEVYAQGKPDEPALIWETSTGKIIDSLISTNRDVRVNAAVALDAQRARLIRELVSIVESTNSDRVKVDAVIVLGEYRASEVVPILVQHLDWDDAARGGIFNARIRKEELEEKTMPVSRALEKIGLPAIPALLDRITQTDDAHITKKCTSICQSIEGREVTQFRLQALLQQETDHKKKERIQFAIGVLGAAKAKTWDAK